MSEECNLSPSGTGFQPVRLGQAGCLSQAILVGLFLVLASQAHGMSWTDRVAWPGNPVFVEASWPAGVLELVNDPLRTDGWRPCFSEWPNDVSHYEFKVSSTTEVNALTKKLTSIKAKVQTRLNPGKEARGLGFTTVLKEGNGTAVRFAIGNQERINQWYQHLKEIEPGVRQFGIHRYTETPKALPPTLTFYVGHAAIDLKSLEIPASVEVSVEASEHYRKENPDDATLKAIDEFVAKHKAGTAATTGAQK